MFHYITNDIYPSYTSIPWQNVKDASVLLICESSVFDNYLLRQFIKQSTTTTVTRTMSDYTFNEWMDDRG